MTAQRSIARVLATLMWIGGAGVVMAAQQTLAPDRIADVLNTKHNFASTFVPKLPGGATRSAQSTEVNEACVFCHTPHAATISAPVQLWNRGFSAATYTYYSSSTLDATPAVTELGNGSKMCLSCHDGTIALGKVNAFNGRAATADIGMSSTNIPNGSGANSGYTSNIGTDLRNDHPIAFEYNAALATADGELLAPGTALYSGGSAIVGIRSPGNITFPAAPTYPAAPLEVVNAKNTLQCTTCHDPHVRGTGTDENVNVKFLRLNRFQKAAAPTGTFAVANDQQCLACHNKSGWANSAHAKSGATPYSYSNTAADQREFPRNLNMWEAGCLNCHDTHTVAGAPKLLRAGASDQVNGGNSATEQTCYQCHGAQGTSALSPSTIADIEASFSTGTATSVSLSDHGNQLLSATAPYTEGHAPVKGSTNLGNGTLSVSGGDLTETQTNIRTNRHVECSDCHHPHRAQTGKHTHTAGSAHSNAISGALYGVYGVEPAAVYGTFTPYDTATMTFTVKQGDNGTANGITAEYQVCVKCHSNYGQDATQITKAGATPNVAAEFLSGTSKHPVMSSTGGGGGAPSTAYVAPFDQALGTQTMYCSDCHESHSGKLKVATNTASLATSLNTQSGFCLNCHQAQDYGNVSGATAHTSGFGCGAPCAVGAGGAVPGAIANLHQTHAQRGGYECSNCHVMRVHGWKNKAFLASSGATPVGVDTAVEVASGLDGAGTSKPYYFELKNSIATMQVAGAWNKGSCSTTCHLLSAN